MRNRTVFFLGVFFAVLVLTNSLFAQGDVLTEDNKCLYPGPILGDFPAPSQSGSPNNKPVYINGLRDGTILACAGSFVMLTASGGGDCDLTAGEFCSGCSGKECVDMWENINEPFSWSGQGLKEVEGNLSQYQWVEVPTDWTNSIVVNVERAECTKANDGIADNKRTSITIVPQIPPRDVRDVSIHARRQKDPGDVRAIAELLTQDYILKDTDGRLMDDPKAKDHHCCKGLTINSTHIFEDINVSDPPLGDMFIINSESKEQAITGPWKDAGLKGDFIVVDSWTYDPNTPPGGPSTERRCFCLNNTTVFMNLGMYLFDNYVWIHEWGHLQGLNDLYDKPDQADYPNNFMNTWKGTYVGYTDYDAWQCDHL